MAPSPSVRRLARVCVPGATGGLDNNPNPSAVARVVLLVTRWARYTPGTRWAEPGPGSWGPGVVALEPGAAGGSGRPQTWWVAVHTAATPTCTTCALGAEVFDFLEQSSQVVAKSVLWSVTSGLPWRP